MGELTHIKEHIGKLMGKVEENMEKQNLSIDESFKKNVTVRRSNERVFYGCKKRLWSVSGPDVPSMLQEARHYFRMYFEDGEYNA